jgi:hypothetical protein
MFVSSFPASAFGAVLCPRVTSEHNADTSDLPRFRLFHQWKDKTANDLAIAIWRYLCDVETGLYHMNEVLDGPDPHPEYATVRDPLKILNVYNVGYCGIFGPVLDGIFQGVGFEQGRSFSVVKWNHRTTEVWYDGAWHYFDLDVRGALMRPEGVIASLTEARTQRDLWVNPQRRVEPFFPHERDKSKVFEIYHTSHIDYDYRWFQGGHTMDFRLRQGESLTRWWRPQGGRWHHIPAYNSGFARDLLLKEPRGYKSNHPDFSVWTQGNGLWRYAPNLTAASTDFADGVESAAGLRPGKDGLELTADRGEAIFEVFSPWIIVPRVNDLADTRDDAEASVLTLDAAVPVVVSVSLDHGRTWREAGQVPPGKVALDLTRHVAETYGFLLRLAAAGRAGQVVLRSLKLDTWVQVAPISLPRLKAGVNRCRYDVGDRYGRQTRPRLIAPDCTDPTDLAKYVVQLPRRYQPMQLTSRIQDDVVMRLDAPPGTRIDWFTAGAAFTTHQNEGARLTANSIAYAVGEPKDFTEVYTAKVPTWVNHWRYQWDQDVMLETPAKTVYVRYIGRPAVNVLRATLHLRPDAAPKKAVVITHAYTVDGRHVEKAVEMPVPGDYTVEVEGRPENEFIRLAVPSDARQ